MKNRNLFDGKLLNGEPIDNNNKNDNISNIFTALIILIMPYIGIFIILLKKPFSKKVNLFGAIYCVLMSLFLMGAMFGDKPDKDILVDKNAAVQQNTATENKDNNQDVSMVQDKSMPFFRIAIENDVKKMYSEGLDFASLDYMQWDPMKNELYHCKNTFTGKMTKKEHTYLARVGYDINLDTSTLYYLAIDGETVLWDEEGETIFMDRK